MNSYLGGLRLVHWKFGSTPRVAKARLVQLVKSVRSITEKFSVLTGSRRHDLLRTTPDEPEAPWGNPRFKHVPSVLPVVASPG